MRLDAVKLQLAAPTRKKEVNMLRQRMEMGPDATTVQKPSATVSRDTAKKMLKMGTRGESKKTAETLKQIAEIAYQLWLDKGCPIGSDQEDWFRAEELLKSATAFMCEDQFRPSTFCSDTHTESEMLAEYPWEGHWEVWEREWVSARWVWDVPNKAA
jgi:hypothetical protein